MKSAFGAEALGMAVTVSQIAWPESRLALKASQCSVDSCSEAVAAELENRPMCLDHFLSESLREMDLRSGCLNVLPVDTTAASALKNFLTACSLQAKELAENQEFASKLAKTRLAEITRRCSQLAQRLRRSPRVAASVPVWLRREDERNTWEEETWTSTLSRHGAGFVCRHSVEINGFVVLCRRDKGSRAQARVVYSRFDSEGRRHIGVELLDREDFWDLPKTSGSPATQSVTA
jgi:hypothetical protein